MYNIQILINEIPTEASSNHSCLITYRATEPISKNQQRLADLVLAHVEKVVASFMKTPFCEITRMQ